MTPRLNQTPFGRTYLHIWRAGPDYALTKAPLFQNEWTSLWFTPLPYPKHDPRNPHDVTRGLPFSAETFDAIYARRILEHLTLDEAPGFLAELRRVLKPGAVCRIVVPDLEEVARHYLTQLDRAEAEASPEHLRAHRWAVMELVDQMVRQRQGGAMARAFARGDFDVAYIKQRFGDALNGSLAPADTVRPRPSFGPQPRAGLPIRLLYAAWRQVIARLRDRDPRALREANASMYDSQLLEQMTREVGLEPLGGMPAGRSAIEGWERYDFDISAGSGYDYEPSLYYECRRPEEPGRPQGR